MIGNFWGPFSGSFVSTVKQFCETPSLSCSYSQKSVKFGYFFPSHLFTIYSLIQLLLPMVKLNGVSLPISIEFKMVHGLSQALFRT